MAVEVRPATVFADIRTLVGPKRPDANVCWCLSYRIPSKLNNELRAQVAEALASQRRVRAVIAHTKETAAVDSGVPGSQVKKTFSVREDLLGTVKSIEGEQFVIRFVRV